MAHSFVKKNIYKNKINKKKIASNKIKLKKSNLIKISAKIFSLNHFATIFL